MNEATLQYVRQHADDDVRMLALCGCKTPEVDLQLALQQIAGRQTAGKKLPSWAKHEDILFPPHLSMEQCSSEQTARYKAELCQRLLKEERQGVPTPEEETSLTDLTGGFGVDFSFLAPLFQKSTYVEQQEHLCQLARHNFNILGLNNEVICANSTDYLKKIPKSTVIFLDPARRNEHGGRTYDISDCTPDVLSLRDELLQKADFVILKLSPMLDWRKAVNDLGAQWVKEVHIVSVQNECKELLVVLTSHLSPLSSLHLFCINDDHVFEVSPLRLTSGRSQGENSHLSARSLVAHKARTLNSQFLYEPNASIMKAGCFRELASRWSVAQIAPNSHLFVSDRLIEDFPGRRFHIKVISSLNRKELKEKVLLLGKANIAVRNFPQTVAELRKRLKLSDGGSHYIFATTLADGNHVLIVCQQLF